MCAIERASFSTPAEKKEDIGSGERGGEGSRTKERRDKTMARPATGTATRQRVCWPRQPPCPGGSQKSHTGRGFTPLSRTHDRERTIERRSPPERMHLMTVYPRSIEKHKVKVQYGTVNVNYCMLQMMLYSFGFTWNIRINH